MKGRVAIIYMVTKGAKRLLVWVFRPLILYRNSVQHTRCLYIQVVSHRNITTLCRRCCPWKAKLSLHPDPVHLLLVRNSGLLEGDREPG